MATSARRTAPNQLQGITAAHGTHTLFSDLDLTVAPGEVTGLVGVNGAGKSTLLRLLAGLDGSALAQGSVMLSPPTATVGYLPQEPDRRADAGTSPSPVTRPSVTLPRSQQALVFPYYDPVPPHGLHPSPLTGSRSAGRPTGSPIGHRA